MTPLTSYFPQNYTRERGFQEPRPTTSSQSLADEGERVLAVGTTEGMGRLAGPSTRTIDLVVIDRDYLTDPADEIREIKSVITDGRRPDRVRRRRANRNYCCALTLGQRG